MEKEIEDKKRKIKCAEKLLSKYEKEQTDL